METDLRPTPSARILPLDRRELVAADHFGDVIRIYRQARGWSQHDLSEHASVSAGDVASAERADGRVRWNTLDAIAAALGVTPYELFARVQRRTPVSPTSAPSDVVDREAVNGRINRLQRLVLEHPGRAKSLFRIIDRFLDLSYPAAGRS